ncbi:MAG TPA: hemolysin family protein [Euzebyales bacterium]|nr:hemolysin family protein [Euzebyales bacterium]
MGIGWQLALVGALVVANALFAGSEIALISLGAGQIQRLEKRGRRGQLTARLARDPNRFLATIQIGITLAGFLASATAAVTLAEPLIGRLAALGAAARPVAIVVVTSVLTFFTLVLGELAPKRLAMQHVERWALLAARPLAALATVARPVVWLLGKATDVTIRVFGGDPRLGRKMVTDEEVRDLIAAGGLYSRAERQIITGALEAINRTLREVVRPRPQVLAVAEDLRVDAAIDRLRDAGHTRAPVYRERLDDADRVVSLLDLVGQSGTVADRARTAVALPEFLPLIDALRALQAARQTMALVVSEYGAIEGIVTVEDLVEEFVGEIHDEYDPDVRAAIRHPDGSITLAGHFPIHDLVDLDVDLPTGDYVTLAGLILDRLGRLPAVGDQLELEGWRITVLAVREYAIQQVRLDPRPPTDARDMT